MTTFRECMHGDGYPAESGKRKCKWHLLLKMPTEDQVAAAEERGSLTPEKHRVARVPSADWPDGERWCSGCQGFVPLFYCTGSRCKAHNAAAAHSGALSSKYGITRDDYKALLVLQDGRCYVCRQLPKSKRLAVDHDHKTNEVRGLLCADVERGCNHAVLGSLEARSVDGVVAAAYRLIAYIENPPYQRLKAGPHAPELERDQGGSDEDPRRETATTGGRVSGRVGGTVVGGSIVRLDAGSIRGGVAGRDGDAEWEKFIQPGWIG